MFYGPKPPVLYIGLHSLSPPNIIKSFSLISQRDARSLSTAGSPSSMALLSLLVSKPSLKTSFLPLTSHLIPIIPSSPLSSHCTTPTFPLPSQSPPVPKKRPFNISAHTRTWQDPYHWMRNAKDPDFVDYLNQENSYAQAFMADTQNLQRTLLEEMKNRLPTQISTPPERWGHWFFPFAPILLTVMTNFITLHYKLTCPGGMVHMLLISSHLCFYFIWREPFLELVNFCNFIFPFEQVVLPVHS